MVRYENYCVGCTAIGLVCMGATCPNRDVPIHYCDKCKYEIDGDVYDVDGEELCEDCLKDMFRRNEHE